ncbi:MAG: hypothetical protein SXQ77_07770, partial [Halobacteria archaeon]|nr:hypothetical protein [Halobacteria archaeon]
ETFFSRITLSAVTALTTAGALGVTHAIEPDHIVGISALTNEYSSAKISGIAGACFSAGHVLFVFVWLGLAYLIFGSQSTSALSGLPSASYSSLFH